MDTQRKDDKCLDKDKQKEKEIEMSEIRSLVKEIREKYRDMQKKMRQLYEENKAMHQDMKIMHQDMTTIFQKIKTMCQDIPRRFDELVALINRIADRLVSKTDKIEREVKEEIGDVKIEADRDRKSMNKRTEEVKIIIITNIEENKMETEKQIKVTHQAVMENMSQSRNVTALLETLEEKDSRKQTEIAKAQIEIKKLRQELNQIKTDRSKDQTEVKQSGQNNNQYLAIVNQFLKINMFSGLNEEVSLEHINSLQCYFDLNKVREEAKIAITYCHLQGFLYYKPIIFAEYHRVLLDNYWDNVYQENVYQLVSKHKWKYEEQSVAYFCQQVVKL